MTVLTRPAPEDTARHYEAAHRRIVALVQGLTTEQLAAPVAATPGWNVHDVLAHLVAIPTDALSGRLQGLPTDELTAEQVTTRKDATVDELFAEWQRTVAPMVDGARAGVVPPNLAVDAVTHEQDIRAAVGAGRVPDAEAVRFSLELYAFGLTRILPARGLPPLRVRASDSDLDVVAGEGEPATTLTASEFELFRALAGRRGRAAVAALDWTGDPAPFVAAINVFGPVPDYDVPD